MYIIKNKFIILLSLVFVFTISCRDLDELNINPNGVDPEVADLNLLLPTIITGISRNVVNLGFGDIAGVCSTPKKMAGPVVIIVMSGVSIVNHGPVTTVF